MRLSPLVSALQRQVQRDPGAVIVASAERHADVSAVDALARGVAARIRRAGIAPGSPIGLAAVNGPGFLAGLLGCGIHGTVPILIDARTTAHEIERIVERLDADGLIRCATGWPKSADDFTLERRKAGRRNEIHADGAAVIKLTSGSTGQPRGILAPVESLLADDEALATTMDIGGADRLLAAVPFSHSYGLSSLVVPALVRGATLVLPEGAGVFSPLAAARECGATVFHTVPAYLGALLQFPEPPLLAPSVLKVIAAGARIPPAVAAGFRERYGRGVHVFYGASECGGIAYDPDGTAAERETVGVPIPGVRVELEPVEDGLGPGQGRVVVRSPAVAAGYLPDADDRLGGGSFVSEDLGAMRGDELALVGRLGDMINVKGRKVNPREVEQVIAQLDSVREVSVIGVERGDGRGQSVRAMVACRPGALTPAEIHAWCRDRLSDYKSPRSIVLVDRLPRTERGKVDRGRLARLAASAHED